ncbi:MAG TPA: hypothetical protein VHL33_05250 [Casimicrobiaceae bacterium]|jgi:hypothetical protein|nr:hypothetical protein [Casimicrobiaceae bacterium]
MKTIVGSFDSFDEAKRVARDLMDEGFRDSDVNVVASNVRGEYSAAGSTAGLAGTSATTGMTGVTGATTTDYTRNRTAADSTLTTDGGGLTDRVRDRDVADDASGAATGAVTGGVVGGAAGLAASLMGLAIPGIGPIIAAGPIVATLSGAGVGAVAGGLIGGLTDLGVSKTDAEYYAESVRRGGALVTVRADDSRAERAADIMRDHGAIDIERRADQWKQRGWTGWNDKAAPYTTADLDRDRDLYGTTDRTTGVAGGMSGTRAGAADIGDRSTAGSAADRGTSRGSGTRTY